ncbi:MAG: cysteine desulfurase family protein [Micropepsaceae bacterium]
MRVYFDNNATAPLRPEARTAMLAALDAVGNASSVHHEGRSARTIVEAARGHVAKLCGADSDNVIFTSGGTEANSLALHGAIQAAAEAGSRFTRLIVSAIEHVSVLATATRCEQLYPGLKIATCPVTPDGQLDVDQLAGLLMQGKGRALVSVMAVNNETGVIQPIEKAAELVHSHSGLLHCDAVQAVGRIPASIGGLGADFLTLSSHKLGGPQGAGALVKSPQAALVAQLKGGLQEFGYRAGTQNVAAVAGFGSAVAVASPADFSRTPRLAFEQHLKELCPDAIIAGARAPRVANTVCIAVPGVPAETLVIALDLDGFAVSAGSACSSGKVSKSHVLAAMGFEPALAACAIRISFGWDSKERDLKDFAQAWARIARRTRARSAA